jgi:D,D-heptose 1,7-bisphosphate phosphatase
MLRQAVVLIDGSEARLGEATKSVPMTLFEIAGKPFIEHVLHELSRYPILSNILLLSSDRTGQAAERYEGMRWRGATVMVATVPPRLGTGGALQHAASRLEDQFLLLNGDSFFHFNLLDLVLHTSQSSAIAHMALKRDCAGDRYGRVVVEGDVVRGFSSAGALGNPINSGVYCLKRRILDFIGEPPCSLVQHVFPRLIEHGLLRAAVYDGFLFDIGIPSDLERAQTELPLALNRSAVFFDRDGVLNVDKNYVHRIEDFEWIAGAQEAIKLCNDLGYLTFVVTNQAGVARGYYGIDAVHQLHDWMSNELAKVGAHIDEFQYCPYHEDGVVEQWRRASDRRKPAPGMILECLEGWPVRRETSILIGDKQHDLEAAAAAGIRGYLFEGGELADFIRPLLQREA